MFRSLVDPKTLAFVALSAVATSLGCSRMPGEPEPYPAAWNQGDIDLGRCVQTCSPDYGPRPITLEECERVEDGLEFFPVPVWDFETPGTDTRNQLTVDPDTGLPVTVATLAYSYQDGTTEFLATDANLRFRFGDEIRVCTVEYHATEPNDTNCQSNYEPTTAPVNRCGSAHAAHLRGGPFREWGGGFGRRLDDVASAAAPAFGGTCAAIPLENPDPSTPAVCPEFDPHIASAPGVYLPPSGGQPEATFELPETLYYRMQVDLREWDGISFWARRGPDSQPGFRIVLADENLDDDASMLETSGGLVPRCQRAKECDCRNHRPCTPHPSGSGTYCWDPKLDESPEAQRHPWNHDPYRCGATACDDPYPAYEDVPDWPFITSDRNDRFAAAATASCNTYTFDNDITRKGCFDLNGPTPPESADRCGDPWIVPVRLSPDWEFYRIPFSDFRQEGYGKEFPAMELSAITMVRFTWHVGWIDYWIDDVRFYRKK